MLHTRLQISDIRKMGRRPNRFDRGFQKRGQAPRITICKEVRYDVRWRETPRSSEISRNAGIIADAVNVHIIALNATRSRFVVF
jgi:hypothetical protein